MCIICVKKKGVKPPSEKILRTCFTNNDDGAGFAYYKPGEKVVHIRKGYMTADALIDSVRVSGIGPSHVAMYHFRLATHGLVDGGNCHPFPVSNSAERLRALALDVPVAVAHNGIFGSMPAHNTLSDTQKFIAQVLADSAIIQNLEHRSIQELIKGYCGTSSKLAFIRVNREVIIIGKWEKHKGLYFSNGAYRVQKFETYGGYATGYSHGGSYLSGKWSGKWERAIQSAEASCNRAELVCDICGGTTGVEYNQFLESDLCPGCLDNVKSDGYKNTAEDDDDDARPELTAAAIAEFNRDVPSKIIL